MKKMNISMRIVICMNIINILTILLTVVGIVGMHQLNESNNSMYSDVVVPIEYIGNIRENYQKQRVFIQEILLFEGNDAKIDELLSAIERTKLEMDDYLSEYNTKLILTNKAGDNDNYKIFVDTYNSFFVPNLDKLVAAQKAGTLKSEDVRDFIVADEITTMRLAADNGYSSYITLSENNVDNTNKLFTRMMFVMLIANWGVLLIAIPLSIYLPKTIAKPIRHLMKVAAAISVGNMGIEVGNTDRSDEIGKLSKAFDRMQIEINKQINLVESLASADLTVEPKFRSDKDKLGKALVQLSTNLNNIVIEVKTACDLITLESADIAAESQELAQGTSEQAASVEQLSSAVYEISLNTKENANLAHKAATLSEEVRKSAVEGVEMMKELTQSVKAADAASKSIDKIIKVIEEISFQTNILALNAAVEAAHAGQNGSGFAVVAAEVRNLASKSAASAKDTSILIADTLEKVQTGTIIAEKTSMEFNKIVDGVIESSKLITDIARSSEEQAIATEQINSGISQVAQVIHINSNSAEKYAMLAEKLSKQSKSLEEIISQFKIKKSSGTAAETKKETAKTNEQSQKKVILEEDDISNEDFGKY